MELRLIIFPSIFLMCGSAGPSGIFFKDAQSIAFYNLPTGTEIQLSLKERGGRKK